MNAIESKDGVTDELFSEKRRVYKHYLRALKADGSISRDQYEIVLR